MAESLSSQNGKSVNRINPEGTSNCIWVDAGLVSYKLCDRDFECEDCQFDQVMRQESRRNSPNEPSTSRPRSNGSIDPRGDDSLRDHGSTRRGVVNLREKIPVGSKSLADGGNSFAASPTYHDALAAIVKSFLSNSISSTLQSDRLYSKNHVWIKKVSDNNYRVGLDKYMVSLFSETWNLILPQTGTVSRRGAPLSWIILEDGTVVVRSPLGGKISKNNFQLRESPSLLNSDPYESGWICEISEAERKDMESRFFDSIAAKTFYDNQFLELEQTIVSGIEHKSDHVGITMMDGGTKIKNLNDVLGSQRYISILKKMLWGGV